MSIYEETVFFGECDECPWVSIEQKTAEQAKTLLDNHIRSSH